MESIELLVKYRHKLFHENVIDFNEFLWELQSNKYKLQVERNMQQKQQQNMIVVLHFS